LRSPCRDSVKNRSKCERTDCWIQGLKGDLMTVLLEWKEDALGGRNKIRGGALLLEEQI
jgi:hypothetical protein